MALIGVFGLWIAALVSGWYYPATGELRRFGLGEMPATYAHEAARFAGSPGMPERALVYDLRQAGVYVFHNAPERKVFMDPRLEVPSRSTFETYVRLEKWLNEGRPGWSETLRGMGDPVVLLDHGEEAGAEATLLADGRWRCVYYDPLASVFLPQRRADLAARFPSVDFAARHFLNHPGESPQDSTGTNLLEARSLSSLGAALSRRPGSPWDWRIPILLLASDRAWRAIASAPNATDGWMVLGTCLWNLNPEVGVRPAGPSDVWDPARSLVHAQSTFVYRRVLALEPTHRWALLALHDSFAARRMNDAKDSIVDRLRQVMGRTQARASRSEEGSQQPPPSDPSELSRGIADRLQRGLPESAVRLAQAARDRGVVLGWDVADHVAAVALHLGEPAIAKEIWKKAADPPSPALRLARIADADLSALDYDAAENGYRAAVKLDRRLGGAWFGLAFLYTQRGEAAQMLAACREAERCELTEPQSANVAGMAAIAGRFVAPNQRTASEPDAAAK
jgi:hypothetical protein